MKTLRILLYADAVDIDNKNKGFFKFLVPIFNEIENFFKIEEIWVGANGGSNYKKYQKTVKDYNVFNFNDGTELLQILKPDLLLMTSREYITNSLLIAAKHEGINSVLIEGNIPENKIAMTFLKLLIIRQRQLLRENKMFFKKYFFLIRTLLKSNYNLLSIFQIIFKDIQFLLASFTNSFNNTHLPNLYICTNFETADNAIKSGADKNKVVVVGDFALDHLYDRFSNLQNFTKNKKIEILFITSGMVEHGTWTYKKYKTVLISIVKAIKNHLSDTAILKFKIHPLSEKIELYREIFKDIDPTIEIFQDTDLSLLVSKSDLIISLVASTALMEVILLKKPIFFINFYNEQFQLVKDNVAKEFKNIDELISTIKDGSFSKINLDARQKFLDKKIYKFDGKCGARAATHILSLFDN